MRGKLGTLRIATPTNSKLAFLQREGLIAPDEIASVEDEIPENFTRLNNRELGAVHSRYAVRYAHAIFVLAKYQSDLIRGKRVLHVEEAKFMAVYKDDYKTKYEFEAAMDLDKGILELREAIVVQEIRITLIEGVAKGYDTITRAASREISRRQAEVAPRD